MAAPNKKLNFLTVLLERLISTIHHVFLGYAIAAFMIDGFGNKADAVDFMIPLESLAILVKLQEAAKKQLSKLADTMSSFYQFFLFTAFIPNAIVLAALVYAKETTEDPKLPPAMFSSAFFYGAFFEAASAYYDKSNRSKHIFNAVLSGMTAIGLLVGLELDTETEPLGYSLVVIQALFVLSKLADLPRSDVSEGREDVTCLFPS